MRAGREAVLPLYPVNDVQFVIPLVSRIPYGSLVQTGKVIDLWTQGISSVQGALSCGFRMVPKRRRSSFQAT
ncbi:MAG: hypothetical protein ABR903_04730 [Thermodesulfovibrionales bacterium]